MQFSIKYAPIFYPEGRIDDVIDKLQNIPDILINAPMDKKQKTNDTLYNYNRNVDLMVKFWHSICLSQKIFKTYTTHKRSKDGKQEPPKEELVWGIKTAEKQPKKYYFIFEKNITKNEEEQKKKKSDPQWSLKQVRTSRTAKKFEYDNVPVLDLSKDLHRRRFDPTYRFEFDMENSKSKRSKRAPKNAHEIRNWLINNLKTNNNCWIEYNKIMKSDGLMKLSPDLAFPYRDRRFPDKITQLVFTEADDINKIYWIKKIDNISQALTFSAQYIYTMSNKQISNKYWWYGDCCKNLNKYSEIDELKEQNNRLNRRINELESELVKSQFKNNNLHTFISNFNSINSSILIGLQTFPSTNTPILDKIEKKDTDNMDEFNQLIIEYTSKQDYNSKLENTHIRSTYDNGDCKYYAAFISSKQPSHIAEVDQVYIGLTMDDVLNELWENDLEDMDKEDKIHIIRCSCEDEETRENLAANTNGFSDSNAEIIEGKLIGCIDKQRIIVTK